MAAKGYKTVIVNTAAAVLPLVDLLVNNGGLVTAMTGGSPAAALSVLGLVNVVLRWVTDTPIFKSE